MGSSKNDKSNDKTVTPDPSPVAQDMIDALTYGPTGYSEDILKNLGMDIPNPGYDGGARPTSGMTTGTQAFGYVPTPVTPDPLVQALATGPATSTKVNDLFMDYGKKVKTDNKTKTPVPQGSDNSGAYDGNHPWRHQS